MGPHSGDPNNNQVRSLSIQCTAKEFIVNGSNRFIGVLAIDQNRDLDLTGGDHLDIDIGFIKRFKHFRRDARVGFHPCANRRNFGYIFIVNYASRTNQIHIRIQQINGRLQIVMADGEADVLCPISSDGLENNIDIDILRCQF